MDTSEIQANNASLNPSISADRRFVAFQSTATNLVSTDTNGNVSDIFVRDLQSGTTELVSVNDSETQGNGSSQRPSISADGRYVAFDSSASNLVTGDTNGKGDVFVRDRQDGTTQRASVDSSGNQGNDSSGFSNTLGIQVHDPSISGDGLHVAFLSIATNLVTGDANGFQDVFVHEVDKTAPVVDSVSPTEDQRRVPRTANVTVTFLERIDPTTVDASTFTLVRAKTGAMVTPLSVTLSDDGKTATFDPSVKLARRTKYTATVEGGDTGFKDLASNPLTADKVWSFTTKRR